MPSRLTPVDGLSSLEDLQKKVRLDSRRSQAFCALDKSMQTWILRKSPNQPHSFEEAEELQRSESKVTSMTPRSGISNRRISMIDECILSLEQAFYAHSAAFDLDGDGTICVEELILIFDRCHLLDEFFTPNKVRNYFATWAEGCNHAISRGADGRTSPRLPEAGIGYEQFMQALQWAAAMKQESVAECARKVVRLSRKLCDKSASAQKRLEVVFDAFCKNDPQFMSAFEFGNLCQKVHVYEEDKFSMGDVYCLFYQINGVVHGKGVDFDGFISVLGEVGQRLQIGDEVYAIFARAVELLDTDEETVNRVRLRLRQAAAIVGGKDWRQFFYECDPDRSGSIDWDEFLAMCRDKLHLADRDSHIRGLFDRLDHDGLGALDIGELINFIEVQ